MKEISYLKLLRLLRLPMTDNYRLVEPPLGNVTHLYPRHKHRMRIFAKKRKNKERKLSRLSRGCPLTSHSILGLGFPLARHTRRPLSSGASNRLVGLSSQ